MKVDKLKIGQTYYLSSCSAYSFRKVTLLEIIDTKHVLLKTRKGGTFVGKADRLHKTPDKAVYRLKYKRTLKREMKKQEERKRRKSKQDSEKRE